MRLRNSTCPAASAPCSWNTCFAMSKPIVVACSMDVSFGGSSTPSPWHTDAVGGGPPHPPIETLGSGGGMAGVGQQYALELRWRDGRIAPTPAVRMTIGSARGDPQPTLSATVARRL